MTYEHYSKVRDYYDYKDGTVASGTGISRSTFTDWKKGNYSPKQEKLQKIADFFGISMELFNQPIGKYGKFHPVLIEKREKLTVEEMELLSLFRNAEDMAKEIAVDALKKHQKKEASSESLKEA